MKKIMKFVKFIAVSLFIFSSTVMPIQAFEKNPNEEDSSNVYTHTGEDGITYTYVVEEDIVTAYDEDGITYTYVVEGDVVTAYDENGVEMASAIIEIKEEKIIPSNPSEIVVLSNYEDWSGYSRIRTGKIVINDIWQLAESVIIGLLIAKIPILALHAPLTWISTVATFLKYHQLSESYFTEHMASNLHCTILVKYIIQFWENSNFTGFIDAYFTNPSWLGDPYDYSYPYACRVLATTY